MIDSVYEIKDCSDEDMFYPMGIFKTFDDAKDYLEEILDADYPMTDYYGGDYGFEKITIEERPFGKAPEWKKVVFALNRERVYCEETDEYTWATERIVLTSSPLS